MKKILGIILLGIPWSLIIGGMIIHIGLVATLVVWGITIVVAAMLVGGICLIIEDKK